MAWPQATTRDPYDGSEREREIHGVVCEKNLRRPPESVATAVLVDILEVDWVTRPLYACGRGTVDAVSVGRLSEL